MKTVLAVIIASCYIVQSSCLLKNINCSAGKQCVLPCIATWVINLEQNTTVVDGKTILYPPPEFKGLFRCNGSNYMLTVLQSVTLPHVMCMEGFKCMVDCTLQNPVWLAKRGNSFVYVSNNDVYRYNKNKIVINNLRGSTTLKCHNSATIQTIDVVVPNI